MPLAADLIVDCLRAHGTDRVFCVPGESYLALIDRLAAAEDIDLVTCRHEGGAGFMALADAKITRRAGVVAVSRGPGATNVAIAVHAAEQDAVPLLVLVGQVARDERGRGAFQEVDYGQMFGGLAKAAFEITRTDSLAVRLAQAFRIASTGTPGPVVVALPEDLIADTTEAPVVGPFVPARAEPTEAQVAAVTERLARALRPLLIVGGALDTPDGRRALAAAASAHELPVAPTFKHQEIVDNASPLFAGHLGFKQPRFHIEALAEADFVLAVGTRLGDVPTQGYRLPRAPEPAQLLAHVYPDPDVIGRNIRADIGLVADPALFLARLAEMPASRDESERRGWVETLSKVAGRLRAYRPYDGPDGMDFGAAVAALAAQAPGDAVVVTDAGNFSGWVHQIWPWDGTQQALGCVGGAMGLGVPGAVAASLRLPGRTVIGFVGDGGLMMTGNELATGVAEGATPKIVVAANRSYGTIRLHQERAFPGRADGTDLVNPDFAAWAQAFGIAGHKLTRRQDAPDIVARFLAEPGAAVLHVETSLEAISPFATLTQLRKG